MASGGAQALLGLTTSAVHQELDRISAASPAAAAAAAAAAAVPALGPAGSAQAACTPQLRAELDRDARATALRLGVEFVSGVGDELEPEPEPEPSAAFAPGQRVVVSGLTGAPELNGSAGVVEGFTEAKGRYAINLAAPGGARRAVAVKPHNLTLAVTTPHPGASATGASAPSASAEVLEKVYHDAVYLSVLAHGLSVCLKPPPGTAGTAPAIAGQSATVSAVSSPVLFFRRVVSAQIFPNPLHPPLAHQQCILHATQWGGWVVTEVFLYNQGVDGFAKYQSSTLPEGLSWDQTNGEIVAEWGEPSEKSGGASTPICLEYASKGEVDSPSPD
jgi:hypothetical protein